MAPSTTRVDKPSTSDCSVCRLLRPPALLSWSKKSCQLLGRRPSTPSAATCSRVRVSPLPWPLAWASRLSNRRTSAFTRSIVPSSASPRALPLSTLLSSARLPSVTPCAPSSPYCATLQSTVSACAAACSASRVWVDGAASVPAPPAATAAAPASAPTGPKALASGNTTEPAPKPSGTTVSPSVHKLVCSGSNSTTSLKPCAGCAS